MKLEFILIPGERQGNGNAPKVARSRPTLLLVEIGASRNIEIAEIEIGANQLFGLHSRNRGQPTFRFAGFYFFALAFRIDYPGTSTTGQVVTCRTSSLENQMRKEHRSWLVVAVVTGLVVFLGMRILGTTTQAQEKRVPRPQFIWSLIKDSGGPSGLNAYRAQVPGGWLVLVHDSVRESRNRPGSNDGIGHGVGIGSGLTFVPDPEHTWRTP